MNRFEELQEKIERQRSYVDTMFEKGLSLEEIYPENVRLDQLITQYNEMTKEYDSIKEEFR